MSEKLRQKEVLERELNRERASLQEQLIKQAKLNEIIRQKDLFEKELVKEKNELQVCNHGHYFQTVRHKIRPVILDK